MTVLLSRKFPENCKNIIFTFFLIFSFKGSSCSDSHETKSQPDQTDGYMDMKPGSVSSSMGNDSGYMDMMMGSNKGKFICDHTI